MRYGIRTRDITILPIGGMARLERIPEKPMQEFWVALAGPAVNVVIAAAIFIYLLATSSLQTLGQLESTGGSFLMRLAVVNVFLVVFNMLPAFPMDGGRVMRALLARHLEYKRATEIAARTGQNMAIVLGVLGLVWNPLLVLIAVFVWIGAEQEYTMVRVKTTLVGLPLKNLMITDFKTLHPSDTLSVATSHLLSGFQQDFPVIEHDGELVGLLTRADLIRSLTAGGKMKTVGSVMQREFQTVDPSETSDGVMTRLQNHECQTLPVVRDGSLVGLLTASNLGEFLMIQDALDSGRTKPSTSRFHSSDPRLSP
jgi:CBS domain-containing protein